MLTVTFYSNYLNHHQKPFCDALLSMDGIDFKFVATEPISEERLKLGYRDMNMENFIVRAYENEEQKQEAKRLALESDITIHGSAPQEYENIRIENGRPLFRYYERFFKNLKLRNTPVVLYANYKKHGGSRNKHSYMLCASAFTAADAYKIGVYKNRCYRWGYFPQVTEYEDIDSLIEQKKSNTILWAGRFIDWKKPEVPILAAKHLKEAGYSFRLAMVGVGEKLPEIKAMVKEHGLEEQVRLTGSVPPEKLREYMEQAEIFLFTSDKGEGWGAVLNESMNSGCAVVASHAIGSVPFLVKDKENGMIYRNGDIDDFCNKVKYLLDNPKERKRMGKAAYKTMTEQWNAKNAAERFIKLAQAVLNGQKEPDIFPDGVCSKAPILKNNWY